MKTIVSVLTIVATACSKPLVTSDHLVGHWRFVRIDKTLGGSQGAGPMHLGFVIRDARGDSVFGEAYSFLTDEPEENRRCNPLAGVRTGSDRFSFRFRVNNPPVEWLVRARIVQHSMIVNDVRAGAEGNVIGLGASLLFRRNPETGGAGCLTSA